MLEAEINRLLIKGHSPEEVAQQVVDSPYTKSESDIFCFQNFLYSTGQWQLLTAVFKYSIKEKKPFAPNLLALLLQKNQLLDDFSSSLAIIKSASEQKIISQLSTLPSDEGLPSELIVTKNNFLKEVQEEYLEEKEHLFEKLQFLRDEQIIEEEHGVLRELDQKYPFDSRLEQLRNEFENRWANYLLSQKPQEEVAFDDEFKFEELPDDQKEVRDIIFNEARQFVELKAQTGYNLAIMFYFMDQYEESLKLIERTPSNYSVDWLKLELFIKTRRFVEALSWAKVLESKYADDPETNFSVTYAQSICLWGLKRGAQAIELLEGLINIRSDYRSAKSLYMKWSGGIR